MESIYQEKKDGLINEDSVMETEKYEELTDRRWLDFSAKKMSFGRERGQKVTREKLCSVSLFLAAPIIYLWALGPLIDKTNLAQRCDHKRQRFF